MKLQESRTPLYLSGLSCCLPRVAWNSMPSVVTSMQVGLAGIRVYVALTSSYNTSAFSFKVGIEMATKPRSL